jgi:hypothetical protein
VGVQRWDLVSLVRHVVQPCLNTLLRPGELESLSLTLAIEQGQQRPHLELTIKGEEFEYTFWAVAMDGDDLCGDMTHHEEALFASLQDFIAESRFGWGQRRP